MANEMSILPVIEPLRHYNLTIEEIARWKERFSVLRCDTQQGYEDTRKAIQHLRLTRGAIERRRVELKADALEMGRRIDAVAKELTTRVAEIENPLRAAKDAVDAEVERVKRERFEAAEAAKRAELEAKLRAEHEAEAEKLAAERARLQAEREAEAERRAAEDKIRAAEAARMAEESARMAEERARFDAERKAERDALEAARRAAAEEAQRQRAAIEAERQRAEAEIRQAEALRHAAERAKRELIEAEERRVAEERARIAAAEEAERARLAAEEAEKARLARLASLAPDSTKLRHMAAELRTVSALLIAGITDLSGQETKESAQAANDFVCRGIEVIEDMARLLEGAESV